MTPRPRRAGAVLALVVSRRHQSSSSQPAAAPASSFLAHVAGMAAWALVIGQAEVGAFAGIFWLMALGGALGIAAWQPCRSWWTRPDSSSGARDGAAPYYSRRQLERSSTGGASRAHPPQLRRLSRAPLGDDAAPPARGTARWTKAPPRPSPRPLRRGLARRRRSAARTSIVPP